MITEWVIIARVKAVAPNETVLAFTHDLLAKNFEELKWVHVLEA